MRIIWAILLTFPFASWAENDKEALFLRRIADFWQEGEYKIAKSQIEDFIVEYPESPFSDPLCAALGDLFLREKNFSNALNYYAKIQSPEFVQKVFLNRMHCLYELQWYATLANECEAYLAQAEDPYVTYFLAIALYHQCINASQETDQLLKLAEKAKPHFETLYNHSELSGEVAQGYAYLSCLLKEYAKAVEIYTEIARKDPSLKEEMLFQIALIQSEYDPSLALGTFETIAQMSGKKGKEAAYNRMVLAFELGRYEELASPDLLNQVPADRVGTARLFLGRSLLEMKQYARAAQELKAYIADAPVSETLFAALLSLLDASYQADDIASLGQAIDSLVEHYPETSELPKALFSKAQMLKKGGNFAEAKGELEQILAKFPSFSQKPQVAFELTHLEYKEKHWDQCYKNALQFLSSFTDHELAPFVWRYFVSSSAEIQNGKPEHKGQFLIDLQTFLRLPMSDLERDEWELLLAKTLYEMRRYDEAIQGLERQESPDAYLLRSLCYRDGFQDMARFCDLAEKGLSKGGNFANQGQIHTSLYNAYLELSNTEKAAEHLYMAFMEKAEIKIENLLWLADTYFQRVLEEGENFVLAARTASLLNQCKAAIQNPKNELVSGAPDGKCKATLHLDAILCKLAKVYSILGKIDDAIATLEPLAASNHEAELILAENYVKKGMLSEAEKMFDAVITSYGTARSPIAAQAILSSARLKLSLKDRNSTQIATQLKNLMIQKNLEAEPIHLEAALEYVALLANGDPEKTIALLQKTKLVFEGTDDLLSKDYHAARVLSPRKDAIYQGYMKLIEAQILAARSKIDAENEKTLQAKSKHLLLQIMEQPMVSCLKERVQTLLADET